jgi:hypothetical protein
VHLVAFLSQVHLVHSEQVLLEPRHNRPARLALYPSQQVLLGVHLNQRVRLAHNRPVLLVHSLQAVLARSKLVQCLSQQGHLEPVNKQEDLEPHLNP